MKKFLILASFLSLTACSSQVDVAISADQIYEGYPCFDQCEAFAAGFEQAKANKITEASPCSTLDSTKQLGCESYVKEYKAEHEADLFIVE